MGTTLGIHTELQACHSVMPDAWLAGQGSGKGEEGRRGRGEELSHHSVFISPHFLRTVSIGVVYAGERW